MGKKTIKYYLQGAIDKIGRAIFPRYKRKNVTLFRYTNALGDALFLTTIAREIKKRNSGAVIHVYTGLPKIFENNPDVDLVTKHNDENIPGLGKHLINYGYYFPWTKHILNYCALTVDIKDEIELKTYIYPNQSDYEWADSCLKSISNEVILVNRKAGPRTDKKNWPDQYWDQLIAELCKIFTVIEIGTGVTDSKINFNNYINLVGKTTIHQTAALMSKSSMLICPVTGLLHLASAFNLSTICILGGSEPSIATQYPATHYLEYRPVCADCYEKGPCVADFICLTSIKPDHVLEKVREVLKK